MSWRLATVCLLVLVVVAGVPSSARLFSFSQFKDKRAESRMQQLVHDRNSIKHTPAQKAFGELEKVCFQPLPKTRVGPSLLGILIIAQPYVTIIDALKSYVNFLLSVRYFLQESNIQPNAKIAAVEQILSFDSLVLGFCSGI